MPIYVNDGEKKLDALCQRITNETQYRLVDVKLDCPANLESAVAHFHIRNKYTAIDQGTSGKLMVDNVTGEIFGIKAYGQIHKGHQYGTLDTIDEWYWGDYYPQRIAQPKG